jgi:hypothetical protein
MQLSAHVQRCMRRDQWHNSVVVVFENLILVTAPGLVPKLGSLALATFHVMP